MNDGWFLEFYILATFRVISGWALTFNSAHSYELYSAVHWDIWPPPHWSHCPHSELPVLSLSYGVRQRTKIPDGAVTQGGSFNIQGNVDLELLPVTFFYRYFFLIHFYLYLIVNKVSRKWVEFQLVVH